MTNPEHAVENRSTVGAGRAVVMAVAAAVATSTSYVLQPELLTVAADLSTTVPAISVVAGAAILGYLAGLLLLVPLADRIRPNRLIPLQLLALAAATAAAGLAPAPLLLGVTLVVAGACASTGAQLSSLAGRFASRGRRALTVGIVTSGISAGIVLGRLVGGALADAVGWRGMLLVVAGICAALATIAVGLLPAATLAQGAGYRSTLVAVIRAVGRPSLTLRAISGSCWFFSFSVVWVGVSLALAAPPLSLPASTIGLYALAGLLGVVVTPLAGRLADRVGSRTVIVGGLTLALACLLAMTVSLAVPLALVACLAIFDAGLFAAQVANQTEVLAIDPDAPAVHNSAYMVVYFLGGTLGSLVGGVIVTAVGWPGVCLVAAGAIALAVSIQVAARRIVDGVASR